ncbi:MAG TPA: PadR family transcriptional regulator [Rhodanobacteraceae bacterium]|jgi:PadR family transcriptional regulator PadR|nr:PadR family transcriptional regulator [Rhodanobacteraceae bacterium]
MGEIEVESHLWKFHKELSAGIVSLVLLAVLANARKPMYGYQIAKQLDETGEGVLSGKQSALYPVLRNLESAGLLASEIEPSISGPPRRYYRITPAGRRVLEEWSYVWTATRDFVDAVLEGT